MREDVGGGQVCHSKEPEVTYLSMTGKIDKPHLINADHGIIHIRQK